MFCLMTKKKSSSLTSNFRQQTRKGNITGIVAFTVYPNAYLTNRRNLPFCVTHSSRFFFGSCISGSRTEVLRIIHCSPSHKRKNRTMKGEMRRKDWVPIFFPFFIWFPLSLQKICALMIIMKELVSFMLRGKLLSLSLSSSLSLFFEPLCLSLKFKGKVCRLFFYLYFPYVYSGSISLFKDSLYLHVLSLLHLMSTMKRGSIFSSKVIKVKRTGERIARWSKSKTRKKSREKRSRGRREDGRKLKLSLMLNKKRREREREKGSDKSDLGMSSHLKFIAFFVLTLSTVL